MKYLLISAWNMPPKKPNQNHHLSCISGRTTGVPKKPSKATAMPRALDGLGQDTRGSDILPGWNLQDNDDITSCSCALKKKFSSGRESVSSMKPRCKHVVIVGIKEYISMNLRVELWRDPLIKSTGWWLECVLLPLGMNVVYSHVQFWLRMNEIFKSKDCLIQSQNGTKGS